MAEHIEALVARGEQYAGPDISLTRWFEQLAPADDPAAILARDRIARIEAASPDDLRLYRGRGARRRPTAFPWKAYRRMMPLRDSRG